MDDAVAGEVLVIDTQDSTRTVGRRYLPWVRVTVRIFQLWDGSSRYIWVHSSNQAVTDHF